MGYFLGLDFGEKKIGLSRGHMETKIAFPGQTLRYRNLEELLATLKEVITEDHITAVVVGLPLNLKGQDTAETKKVRFFSGKLRNELTIPVFLQDERLSSQEAGKIKIKKQTPAEDSLAAQIILQSYFDRRLK